MSDLGRRKEGQREKGEKRKTGNGKNVGSSKVAKPRARLT